MPWSPLLYQSPGPYGDLLVTQWLTPGPWDDLPDTLWPIHQSLADPLLGNRLTYWLLIHPSRDYMMTCWPLSDISQDHKLTCIAHQWKRNRWTQKHISRHQDHIHKSICSEFMIILSIFGIWVAIFAAILDVYTHNYMQTYILCREWNHWPRKHTSRHQDHIPKSISSEVM